jgi:hypothetical protein
MQAIASVASVAVTVVLVVITARYVRLTKGLAEAANAELLRQIEASKARRRELASQVEVLRSALDVLPNGKNYKVNELFWGSVSWDDFDFGAFRKLASEVTDAAASYAATVESEMRRMEEMLASLKSITKGKAFTWDTFPQVDWDTSMRATGHALASILTELSTKR